MENTIGIFSVSGLVVILVILSGCSNEGIPRHPITPLREQFVSGEFLNFEGGVLFPDVALGLNILWEASFRNGKAYKENLGFFISGGLLILPNADNTYRSARLNALPNLVKANKLFVAYKGTFHEVLGIIHSHPDIHSVRMPSPRNDYQFSYLGIHNYVMGHNDLFDAYIEPSGNETYTRLGPRESFELIRVSTSDLGTAVAGL